MSPEAQALPEPQARFMRACFRLPVDTTPVWFMRQAGRYMPEYRAIRRKYSLLEIVQHPELVAEITLQPVHALGVDAAILFSDILLPLIPMGLKLEFARGEGPMIHNPVRRVEHVARLGKLDARGDLGAVLEAIRILRKELGAAIPLIGFTGAPFTLASYMIEGGASRNFQETKRFMYGAPQAWAQLMEKLAEALGNYLLAQVEAGAQAVQVFDSWVGALGPQDYVDYVFPYTRCLLSAVEASQVPVIHFAAGASTLLPWMKTAGGSVIGLDWRIPLDEGWQIVGPQVAVQGNLDPAALFAPQKMLEQKVRDVLARAGKRPGHVFNLGHGILPETPVENVRAVVEMVHEMGAWSKDLPGNQAWH